MRTSEIDIRRPRYIGTGTMLALVIAGVLAFQYINRLPQPPPSHAGRSSGSATFKLPNEPDTMRILAAREQLALTVEQAERLQKLHEEWRAKSKPAEEILKRRNAEAQTYLDAAAKKHPTMEELQRHIAPVSQATADYLRLRNDFQRRALAILTSEQRALWTTIGKEKGGRK